MNHLITSYIASIVIMGALDALWFLLTLNKLYRPRLGHLLSESPTIWAGVLFYLLYALGICVFVIWPALKNSASLGHTFLMGALFGTVAYGTFDLTCQALFKDWPPLITFIDIFWGALITGLVGMVAQWLTSSPA